MDGEGWRDEYELLFDRIESLDKAWHRGVVSERHEQTLSERNNLNKESAFSSIGSIVEALHKGVASEKE